MTTRPPVAVFRCDASPSIGGGHVMRCLALADALVAAGWTCRFAVGADASATVPRLAAYDPAVLASPVADEPEALARIAQGRCELLIVDHYQRDARFERRCRAFAQRIAVIDDLADRPHDCDLLLDATLGREAQDYGQLVPQHCRLLLGPAHALLRPQFRHHRAAARLRRASGERANRVLVSFGASDPHDLTPRVLSALLAREAERTYDVLLGVAPETEVAALAAKNPTRVRLHRYVENVAAQMVEADLAVGAAGTTSWERCTVGLPSVIVTTADNQCMIAARLAAVQAGLDLGFHNEVSAADVADAVIRLANDTERLARMSESAFAICDGLGALRVQLALCGVERARDGKPVRLRPAEERDREVMFLWQTRPGARRFSRVSRPPVWDEHCAWFDSIQADPRRLLFVIEHAHIAVGSVRLDPIACEALAFEVSILVDPPAQGCGIASAALRFVRRLVPGVWLEAEVGRDNTASHALFTHAGYQRTVGDRYRNCQI